MKARFYVLSLSMLVILAVAVGCGPTAQQPTPQALITQAPATQAPATQAPAAPCVIRIGFFGPLTGSAADLGNDTANAAQLAIDQTNKAGGVTLSDGKVCTFELVKGDDEMNPEKGLAAVQRLISESKVDIIVGCVYSAVGLAVLDPIEKQGVPFINTVCASIKIPQTIAAKKYQYIFSASPTTDLRGERAAEVIQKVLKPSKLALVLESGDSGRDDGSAQKAYYAKNAPDVKVVVEEYADPTTTDFSPVLAKLRAAKPDVVYSMFLGVATTAFAKQYCEQGIEAPPVSGFVPADFQKQLGNCANGWIINEVWSPRSAVSPATLPFAKDFEARFGKPPGYWAAQEYDGVLMAVEAFRRAGKVDKAAVAAALQNVRITGARGQQYFLPVEQGRTVPATLVFSQILDGNVKVIWPLEGAEAKYVPYKPPK